MQLRLESTYIAMLCRRTFRCSGHTLLSRHHEGLASDSLNTMIYEEGDTYCLRYRRVRIKPMALQNVDVIELQTLQTVLNRIEYVLVRMSVIVG